MFSPSQLFVRAFAKDGSSKSILVDEKMTVSQVCSVLADKHHGRLTHDMAVIEHMPELFMGEHHLPSFRLSYPGRWSTYSSLRGDGQLYLSGTMVNFMGSNEN